MTTTKLNLMGTTKSESKPMARVCMDEVKELSVEEFKPLENLNQIELGDLVVAVKDGTEITTGGYVFDINAEFGMLSFVIRSDNGRFGSVYNVSLAHTYSPLYYRNDRNLEAIEGEKPERFGIENIEKFLSTSFELPVNGVATVDLSECEFYPEVVSTDKFQSSLVMDENNKAKATVRNITNSGLTLDYGDLLDKPFPREIKDVYGENVDYSYVRLNFKPNYENEINETNIQDIQEDDFVFGVEKTSKGMRVCGGRVRNTIDDGVCVDCMDPYNGARKTELKLDSGRLFKLDVEDVLNPAFY